MWLTPEKGCSYHRELGLDVKIIAVGYCNAVGVDMKGKFYMFKLDGRGAGHTGNLIEKISDWQAILTQP